MYGHSMDESEEANRRKAGGGERKGKRRRREEGQARLIDIYILNN